MVERAQEIGKEAFETEYNNGLIAFLRGVDSLVFDTHFNEKNLKPDWGHATPEIAIDLCAKAGVKRLFMFHHAPEDNDSKVALKQTHARELALRFGIEVINAREEDQWPLISA
jgi:ribonuclease BN (tRNA processing enzyme)